jgi:hypothetical protein
MSFQTLPYTDLAYSVQADGSYHSSLRRAAASRLSNQLSGAVGSATRSAMAHPASKQVWAIVMEYDGQPMYVLQNVKQTLQPADQRRVLRVRLEYFEPRT